MITLGINYILFCLILWHESDFRPAMSFDVYLKITFNQTYDSLQAKYENNMTMHLLDMAQQNVFVYINQFRIIIIVSTAIQNFSNKDWKHPFISANLTTHPSLYFSDWIKKIEPYVKKVETYYFWNNKESC